METFIGDTIKIVLKTDIDLSGYSNLQIKFKRPDGTIGVWDASLSVDSDEWMEYNTLTTDLNAPGVWALQAYISYIGIELHGKWDNLIVFTPIANVP